MKSINSEWGYQNKYDEQDYQTRLGNCFKFPQGLLSQSEEWLKQVKKWAARLQQEQTQAQQVLDNGAWRVVLHHARLCLMLGDHYYSSCPADKNWRSTIDLFANTDKQNNQVFLKQKLDEHLVRVSDQALKISQSLSRFTSDMELAFDIKALKQKSPKSYEWQDRAVEKINGFKKQHTSLSDKGYGWFVVNMASTGCGKTIANAKIMQALSDNADSLRYILALGLRTLTLQTGDEYRNQLKLKADELAVLIGSSAVKALHEKSNNTASEYADSYDELGSESMAMLLDEELDYSKAPTADFLDAIIPKYDNKQAEKNKAFLYKPVLACTIDHIIAATETTRGGKYILPCLRLLSSDLVIDEVDDFDGKDLIAIARLIHLAAMLGRKVMISSATIPPALAQGFFNAYQEGWRLHRHFRQAHTQIACAWVDEFATQIQFTSANNAIDFCSHYAEYHQQFIRKRVERLQQQVVKRKAYIVRCDDLYTDTRYELSVQVYFEKIKQTAIQLHQQHHFIDDKTGKKISFGVVRIANISPCIQCCQYLLEANWDDNFAPKLMAYHSRQILLLRHNQEQHLDQVLKRKEKLDERPVALDNSIIREHINTTSAENVLFILIATPVEEVGRDHDFDWAIIEPSSYRSIIQLAGRVRRHRQASVEQANIAIMQYNLKALRNKDKPAYTRPGYENTKSLKLNSHDLCQLIDETSVNKVINAIPRIEQAQILYPNKRLADLEHQAIINSLTNYTLIGPQCLQAWLTECWWLTALPQQLNRFRDSSPDTTLYCIWQYDKAIFHERNERGEFINREQIYGITQTAITEQTIQTRFWLNRNYKEALQELSKSENDLEFSGDKTALNMRKNSERYGEITVPIKDKVSQEFIYNDQFGLL